MVITASSLWKQAWIKNKLLNGWIKEWKLTNECKTWDLFNTNWFLCTRSSSHLVPGLGILSPVQLGSKDQHTFSWKQYTVYSAVTYVVLQLHGLECTVTLTSFSPWPCLLISSSSAFNNIIALLPFTYQFHFLYCFHFSTCLTSSWIPYKPEKIVCHYNSSYFLVFHYGLLNKHAEYA